MLSLRSDSYMGLTGCSSMTAIKVTPRIYNIPKKLLGTNSFCFEKAQSKTFVLKTFETIYTFFINEEN